MSYSRGKKRRDFIYIFYAVNNLYEKKLYRKCEKSLNNPEITVLGPEEKRLKSIKLWRELRGGVFIQSFSVVSLCCFERWGSIVPGGGSFHTTWLTFSFPQLTSVVWTLGGFDRDSARVNHRDHWFCLDEWGKKSTVEQKEREREAVSYDDKISYWIRSTSRS